jgi:antitoxin PrlF
MATGTMTSKGQITIPAEVRRELGLRAGSRVAFVRTADGGYLLRPETGSVRSLKGSVAGTGRPVTLAEMDEAIASGAAE